MNNDLKMSFYLKKNEIDYEGKCPVMGRIKVGKTEVPFSVKLKIPLSLWGYTFRACTWKKQGGDGIESEIRWYECGNP
jgi:hypothetical protein